MGTPTYVKIKEMGPEFMDTSDPHVNTWRYYIIHSSNLHQHCNNVCTDNTVIVYALTTQYFSPLNKYDTLGVCIYSN